MTYAKKPNLLRRLVDNEFGTVIDGQVVFPECNPEIHFSKEALKPLPDYPIYMGLDGGRTPAAVFFQMPGYARILDELVVYDATRTSNEDMIYLERMGPKYFGELTREFVADRYGAREIEEGYYDPSIDFGQEEDAYDWLKTFNAEFPCKMRPGGQEGNRVQPRLDAVTDWLNASPGGRPGMLISTSCKVLRRGFSGGYIVKQVKTSTGPMLNEKPAKGPFSHAQDGLQHGLLGWKMRGGGIQKMQDRRDDRHQGTAANRRGQQRFVKMGGYAGARS
jgi:hypothetical protein